MPTLWVEDESQTTDVLFWTHAHQSGWTNWVSEGSGVANPHQKDIKHIPYYSVG